jgi:PD-(D/E)XK nuclease superfamily protein
VKKRKKIIKDKKLRGEWAESVFMVRAGEQGLPVSKPWGDSNSFDCVVGRPGKFVAVQVKGTFAKLESGAGYICSTCSSVLRRFL